MEEQFFTDQDNQNFENAKLPRPFGLSFICVLSFINAGWQFFAGIVTFLTYNMIQGKSYYTLSLAVAKRFGVDAEEFQKMYESALNVDRSYYLLTALLYGASFVGVYFMWKQMKKGFHIYTIAQILILIVLVLMVTRVTGASPWDDVFMTSVFVALYYINYKRVMY